MYVIVKGISLYPENLAAPYMCWVCFLRSLEGVTIPRLKDN
jgi:hypothetical protein